MISTLKRSIFCAVFVVSGSEILTGCTLISDIWNQDSIAEYGETVFRKQNWITSQVMMLSESDLSPENAQKLQQAESQMEKECKLLNEYASREMDKTAIDLAFQKRVRDSISRCDLSLQAMQSLLTQLGIND